VSADHAPLVVPRPWSPDTLRNLFVAVLLPLALYVAQNLLGRRLRL